MLMRTLMRTSTAMLCALLLSACAGSSSENSQSEADMEQADRPERVEIQGASLEDYSAEEEALLSQSRSEKCRDAQVNLAEAQARGNKDAEKAARAAVKALCKR
ncbi:hypothetical protein [Idiomarina xiamenensis]|uniref:Lipoprotein n=1 Tax=Idiomarina xiamenensis 10-D-4 TaxID=740709 RepID=K2JJ55_9GAMM|nr:hypothetical protein [Idiomarina xiamenensis]EKE83456.1 hypothetical protein A10D4_08542 [Idiomarina xiamenensis 10-D-4]